MNLAGIAPIFVGVLIAVSGFFVTNSGALASRIDSLASQQASTQSGYEQYAKDTDQRLTRIENKIDQLVSSPGLTNR